MTKKAKGPAFAAQLGPEGLDALGLIGGSRFAVVDADVECRPSDPKAASRFLEIVGELLKEKPLPCVGCGRSFEFKPDGVGALVRMRHQREGLLAFLACHDCAQQRTAEELVGSAVRALGGQLATD
jgi:hypothetical protein